MPRYISRYYLTFKLSVLICVNNELSNCHTHIGMAHTQKTADSVSSFITRLITRLIRQLSAMLIIPALVQPSTTIKHLHYVAHIRGAQEIQVKLLLEQVRLLANLRDGFAAAAQEEIVVC